LFEAIENLDRFDLRQISCFWKVASEVQTHWKVKVLSGKEHGHVPSRGEIKMAKCQLGVI